MRAFPGPLLSSRSNSKRSRKGTTIAEFGPTLLLAFAVVILPLLALGTIGLRYYFLVNGARLAAVQASRARSFLVDVSPTDMSAVNTATAVAKNTVNGIGAGLVTINSINTFIKVCPLGGNETMVTTPGPNKPLAKPADPNANTYNCEVVIDGTIQPIFPKAKSIIGGSGGIPGFTDAIQTTVRMDCFFESTSNLNQ